MIENYDPTELYQGKRVYYPASEHSLPFSPVNTIEEVVVDIHADARKQLPVGAEYVVLYVPARMRTRGSIYAEGYVYWSSGGTPHQLVTDEVDEFTDTKIYSVDEGIPVYKMRRTFIV